MSTIEDEYSVGKEIVYGGSSDSASKDDGRKNHLVTYLYDCYDTIRSNVLAVLYFLSPIIFYFSLLFWPFIIPHLLWIYYDRETPHQRGRTYAMMRKLRIFKWTTNYFPIKMVKTCELPADRNYMFASFPHGLSCYGAICNFMTEANNFSEAFPGLNTYLVTLKEVFYFPTVRYFSLSLGFRASSARCITDILNGPPGTVCVVIVGGANEMMMSVPGTNKLFLRNRKGFVRLALKTGVPLIPVYSFGETDVYYQPSGEWYKRMQDKIKAITKVSFVIIFNGRGIFQNYFGFLPYRAPITTVVGKPIDVPKMENPTEEDVNKYHQKFIRELEKLFNSFKEKYDKKGREAVLEIY